MYLVTINYPSGQQIVSRHRSLVIAWANANQLITRLCVKGSADLSKMVGVEKK